MHLPCNISLFITASQQRTDRGLTVLKCSLTPRLWALTLKRAASAPSWILLVETEKTLVRLSAFCVKNRVTIASTTILVGRGAGGRYPTPKNNECPFGDS